MTREEAKMYALETIEGEMQGCDPNDGFCQEGDKVFSFNDMIQAVENDTCLEGTNYNPIDNIIELDEELRANGEPGLLEKME